jgi:YHS domain-containing protein
MARVKDPVCGMMIDSDSAAATSSFQGQTYYFCSADCKSSFDKDPARFAQNAGTLVGDKATGAEPPFTKKGGFVAPKFGAAGSGGAEYEQIPKKPEDRH